MSTKEIRNFFSLHIVDKKDEVIRIIEITAAESFIMKDLITDIYENESGGITIRLKLKTNYAL
jgi:hypothetical protein